MAKGDETTGTCDEDKAEPEAGTTCAVAKGDD
jgi:hypothetical protein